MSFVQAGPARGEASGFPNPPHAARLSRSGSHPPSDIAITQQPEFEFESPASLSTWRTRSNHPSVVSPSSKRKSRYIPIDISQYAALGSSESSAYPRLGEKKVSLPEIPTDHDRQETRVRPSVKRHVPIVIPAFAHPFVDDISKKPPFQHTVQAWPAPPRLRREIRQLPPTKVGAELGPNPIDADRTKRIGLTNGTGEKMHTLPTNQTMTEMMRDGRDGLPEPGVSHSGQNGAATSISPQMEGTGPTNLSGLVCNVHRTTGREPHALVGATTTILGDKLYVFGGRILSRRRPHLTSDLYQLDLVRRHWSKLETFGEMPPPRYFHSVCALGDTKLVCYGGMSPASYSKIAASQSDDSQPEVVVMSDIHIYDVPTRTWMFIPTPDNPQGRYAHCATILPSSATFTSPTAPFSAIQHNPSSSNPHSGSIGLKIDGAGGAEMVVVGGQDSANHYIEQISVFNLRSLKWTATNSLGRQCGAYRSVVTPLTGTPVSAIGRVAKNGEDVADTTPETRCSMLIYSNYNFLDVKLELQIRYPDGRLNERFMGGAISPLVCDFQTAVSLTIISW